MRKGLLTFVTAMLCLARIGMGQDAANIPDGIYQYINTDEETSSFIKIQQEHKGLSFFYGEGTLEELEPVAIDIKNDSTFLCRPHGGLYFYKKNEKCLILPLIDIRGNDIDKKYCLFQELEGD